MALCESYLDFPVWTSFMEAGGELNCKNKKKNSAVFFSQLLVIKTPDPDSVEMLDPDSINPNPQD